jgi:hypothetical protein
MQLLRAENYSRVLFRIRLNGLETAAAAAAGAAANVFQVFIAYTVSYFFSW